MSISSVLAFVLAGVAAKAKSVQVARRSELEAERDRQRIAELEADVARANIQYRRDQELIDIWRERALGGGAQRPAGPDFRPPQIALQQAAAQMQALQAQQNMLAQHNAQAAMNAQNFYNQGAQMNAQNFYNQGAQQQYQNQQLLAQSLIDAELFCNCVPARHDMFLRGR
jgi:hypothetical protein